MNVDRIVEIMAESTSYFILPDYAREAIDALNDAGYVIVHRDEVPDEIRTDHPYPLPLFREQYIGYEMGWDACRRSVFGSAS